MMLRLVVPILFVVSLALTMMLLLQRIEQLEHRVDLILNIGEPGQILCGYGVPGRLVTWKWVYPDPQTKDCPK